VILEQIAGMAQEDPHTHEVEEHEAFGRDRARHFVGRTSMLGRIADYLAGDDPHPLAVSGASGSGKSALLARALEEARRQHAGAEVVARFIGATPLSSDGRSLLEHVSRQITHLYGGDEASISTEYKALVSQFPERLSLATPQRPLILFLDALDQLSGADHARTLAWLPQDLPPHVRVVLSTLPGARRCSTCGWHRHPEPCRGHSGRRCWRSSRGLDCPST
jgi:Cdc6-like AAA superfamily ATPase